MSFTTEPKLKPIGMEEFRALPGKFRVITIIDSDLYQVNEDVDDVITAKDLAYFAVAGRQQPTQVFDDKGNKQL